MIDEKKIEEAAEKAGAENHLDDAPIIRAAFNEDFKNGINWFLDNLWHDASEEPKEDENILLELRDNSYVVIKIRSKYDILEYPYKSVTRWLYIDDLMKGGANEQ